MSNEILEASIATNVRGCSGSSNTACPPRRAAKRGTSSIVAIGVGYAQRCRQPVYWATKAPVEVMVRSLAREFGGACVRVNCVSSGLIETESEMRTMTGAFRDYVLSLNALPYFGQPEDIANACLYLTSDEARYVTGTTLTVNGGASF